MPAFVAVGIDSSDAYHDIHAEVAGVETRVRLRIENSLGGFQRLEQQLTQTFGDLPRRYGVENPTLLLSRYLLATQAAVYALNPRSVMNMRQVLTASGKKDDPLDARSAALLLQARPDLTPVTQSSPAGELVAGLTAQRTDVVEGKTRLVNQLTAALKSYYPRALELFPKLEQPLTLAFLQAFPSPLALAQAERPAWDALFAGKRYPQPRRIERLWTQAQLPQVGVSGVDVALGLRVVGRLVRCLQVLLDELAQLEAEIAAQFALLPHAKTFASLPGAGPTLAPCLFALLGDNLTAWERWEEVARASGVAPITRTSGNSRSVRMRRHCNHRARRTLHLFAGCSRRNCAWAQEFYAQQRQLGKSHATALRNLALKWLRILFRLWQEGSVYDEAEYLRRRTARQRPHADRAAPTS